MVIVDLPPPGAISGVGVGTACILGEFSDMRFAVDVNPITGAVTTKPQPVEIFSGQDLLDKVGGFDETIGKFGSDGGNGFVALRNKRYVRLVVVPINLASANGARLFRDLPTNISATDPTSITPVAAATVVASREFKSGSSRVRLGTRHDFTATGAFAQGVDGDVTAIGAAVTQTFTSAGSTFLTAKDGSPVQAGDLLVLGKLGEPAALGDNAATYRVTANATLDTQLTVEKLDGASFDWTTGAALPFRLHPASDGDSGGQVNLVGAAGYILPSRPLDATIAASASLAPTLVPPAATGTTTDPLSGLTMRTDPTNGLVFTAGVQAPNAANVAAIDALYDATADSLLTEDLPARDVNILFSARHSSTIRAKLKSHVLAASGQGVGRVTCVSPELDEQDVSTILGDADPGVGSQRDERVFFTWPGARTFVPEAVGFQIEVADGTTTDDGILDTHFDAWLASNLSNLPPERNPGQAGSPVKEVFAPILGIQRGVTGLGINEYTQFRSQGIAALRIDRRVGPIIQSGITTSQVAGQKNINRRRMADFIQDSLANALLPFAKLPLTDSLKDSEVAEVNAFMIDLQSPNNPPAQRIVGFLIDDVSGNTPDLEAKGIFVIIVKVRTLATQDFITIQTEVGENVTVTAT